MPMNTYLTILAIRDIKRKPLSKKNFVDTSYGDSSLSMVPGCSPHIVWLMNYNKGGMQK